MEFSLGRVLRSVSPDLLNDYFRSRGLDNVVAALESAGPTAAASAIERDGAARDTVSLDLRRVHDLASEHGMTILAEELHYRPAPPPAEFERLEAMQDKVMWVFLHDSETFEIAELLYDADSKPARLWSHRRSEEFAGLHITKDMADDLAESISDYLVSYEGRGHRCTAERYKHGDKEYVFCFPDDYSGAVPIHNEQGILERRVFKPTFEIVFTIDPKTGTVGVNAQGPAEKKEALLTIFVTVALEKELPPRPQKTERYRLEGLKLRTTALQVDEKDGFVLARVRVLRLTSSSNRKQRLTVEASVDGPAEEIYDILDDWLATPDGTRLHGLRVQHAQIDLWPKPIGKRHGKKVLIRITLPMTCNLDSMLPRIRSIGERYLREWEIDTFQKSMP